VRVAYFAHEALITCFRSQQNFLQRIHVGQVDADGDQWYEIKAAFKLEKQPSKVIAYVQGPPAGVDLRVMDFYIYAVRENKQGKL
jgi:hypothetical protein